MVVLYTDIDLYDLFFHIKNYKGEIDTNLDIFVAKFDEENPTLGGFFERGHKTHFFLQTACAGFQIGFSYPLVGTAGIGPQQRRMVFMSRTLLQHQFVLGIKYKHRKRSVQYRLFMGFHFWHGAYLFVLCIHKNDLFFHHATKISTISLSFTNFLLKNGFCKTSQISCFHKK